MDFPAAFSFEPALSLPLVEDHAASLANAREGYIAKAESKGKVAEVERERQKLAKELDAVRASQKEWQDRAHAAETEMKKNRDAADSTIVELEKKYQKVRGHVLKHFHGTLGKRFPLLSIGESPSTRVCFALF